MTTNSERELDSHSDASMLTRMHQLEEENTRLRQLLRDSSSLSLQGITRSSLPPSSFTIPGLEESVLVVDPDGLIRYANRRMAIILGAVDKHELLRKPVVQWDRGPLLPAGFILTLMEGVRASAQTVVSEIECRAQGPNATGKTLRCVAYLAGSSQQLVVQDVTQLRWLERTFSRYVSPEIINRLMQLPLKELQRMERRTVSVLFTDLRGFTAQCEALDTDCVCELLNSHFEVLLTVVRHFGGTVDKFIGDSLMAVFGAPLQMHDHALRSLLAGLCMQKEHAAWTDQRKQHGLPIVPLGIGIASGEVAFGNIGTPERMDFTVLGHTVNLASRLVNKAAAGQVLTEPTTYLHARETLDSGLSPDFPMKAGLTTELLVRSVGTVSLKNIHAPVDVLDVRWSANDS